jgi:hypothetical protein
MRTGILSHLTHKKFTFDPGHTYMTLPSITDKPCGLWLSDESKRGRGWSNWCKGENWNVDGLLYETIFECDMTNWKVIKTPAQMKKFHRDFSAHNEYSILSSLGKYIDWAKVQKEFAGILIAPYRWDFRFHMEARWYYSWDCASACVWDLSTVNVLLESIESGIVETEKLVTESDLSV